MGKGRKKVLATVIGEKGEKECLIGGGEEGGRGVIEVVGGWKRNGKY